MNVKKSTNDAKKKFSLRNRYRFAFGLILTCIVLSTFLITPVSATPLNLQVKPASTIPTIDGVLTPGEWDDAQNYSFYFVPTSIHPADDIVVFLKYSGNVLYIAYDVQPDNTTDNDDMGMIQFDLNNNGTQDLYMEIHRDFSTLGARLGSGEYNLSNLIWGIAFGNTTSPLEQSRNHTTIEFAININRTLPYTNQAAASLTALPLGNSNFKILFSGYGTLTPTWVYGNSSAYTGQTNFNGQNASVFASVTFVSPAAPPIPGFELLSIIFGLLAVIGLAIRKKQQKI